MRSGAMSTTDGPFNWEGEFFHYRNVNIWPRPYQQPTPPVWMTGLSVETGRMAAERGHVVGTLLSLSAAGPMFETYRKRAQELGWTADPDRFAYAAVVGVGATREEGLRRANLAADYVRTSPVVAEPFTNPPGYNSVSANVAMLKAGGRRGGFVRDRHGNPVEQTTASIEQLIESGTCFAGTPDDVYDQIQSAQRQRRRLWQFVNVRPRRLPGPQRHRRQYHALCEEGLAALARTQSGATESGRSRVTVLGEMLFVRLLDGRCGPAKAGRQIE